MSNGIRLILAGLITLGLCAFLVFWFRYFIAYGGADGFVTVLQRGWKRYQRTRFHREWLVFWHLDAVDLSNKAAVARRHIRRAHQEIVTARIMAGWLFGMSLFGLVGATTARAFWSNLVNGVISLLWVNVYYRRRRALIKYQFEYTKETQLRAPHPNYGLSQEGLDSLYFPSLH